MASTPRTIHLRRPPVVAMQEGVFVPKVERSVLEEVERRWDTICNANPAAFDGRVCHVLGVHRNGHGGATIYAIDCAYRFFAVQDDGFDLGVRPLGVKGVVVSAGRVLIGRRSAHVSHYSGLREFAPGGVVEPGVEPALAIERELIEETGLAATAQPAAIAILYDAVASTWEVLFRIVTNSEVLKCSSEHVSLEWANLDSISQIDDFSPISLPIARLLSDLRVLWDSGSGWQPTDEGKRIVR